MKNWFDYTIEERIEINKKQGFTIDNLYPEGTAVRKRWDKMIEETNKNIRNHFAKENIEKLNKVMDKSPEELLKEKING